MAADASKNERDARFQDLVSLLVSVPESNFDAFHIYHTTYRSVGGLEIGTDILVPRVLKTTNRPRPVIVRIHGGFLITGSSLFPAWFSKWILDFAEAQSAIIVSPDYRLLPEAKGLDILADMQAFWTWFNSEGPARHLAQVGRADVTLNSDKLLLLGESAGGYLALQSVLSGFAQPNAMVFLYPMLDMKADHYNKEYPKPIVNVPNFPREVIDKYLTNLDTRPVITTADPPSRLDLALAAVHTGRFLDLLGREPELFALDRIEKGNFSRDPKNTAILPPFFLIHGESDSAVPVQGTHRFLATLKKADPDAEYRLTVQPGDHGFEYQATLQDEWLMSGLDWVVTHWLGTQSRI